MVRTAVAVFFFLFPVVQTQTVLADPWRPLLPVEKNGMRLTLQSALEYNDINQATVWKNAEVDSSIQILPTLAYQGEDGRQCREFRSEFMRQGKNRNGFGTACRKQDGEWEILTNIVYNESKHAEESTDRFVASRSFYYSARNPYYMPRGRHYRYMMGYHSGCGYCDTHYGH